jgi:hypothetical protein
LEIFSSKKIKYTMENNPKCITRSVILFFLNLQKVFGDMACGVFEETACIRNTKLLLFAAKFKIDGRL